MKKGISARQFLAGIIAFIFLLTICPALSSSPTSTPTPIDSPTRTPGPTFAPTKTVRAPTRTLQAAAIQACVVDTSVRVRQGPGTQYPAIDGLASGTCVTVLGRSQDSSWIYMRAGAKTGWVAAWLLDIEGSLAQAPLQTVANALPSLTAAPVHVTQNKKTPQAQNVGDESTANSEGNNSSGNNSSGENSNVGGGGGDDSSGPSALCNDGTYSYSSRRRGTCSHHGGVAEWYKDLPP